MLRIAFVQILLFLLPFALYALYLLFKRQNPLTGKAWLWKHITLLGLIGFLLSITLFGLIANNSGMLLSGRGEEKAGAEDRTL